MIERQIVLPFAPRTWQIPLINDPAPRIVAVVHRRAGKSHALMWRGMKRALIEPKPLPRVVHILPYGVMWKRTGLWDQVMRAARAIPGADIAKADLAIRLPNGGTFQCGSGDNPDSWRGGYADEVTIDEYDDTPQSLVPLVIEPMLADRQGTLVRSGTPKGNGVLQAAFDRGKTGRGYSTYLLDCTMTNALSDEAIERLREEMTEEEFAQEMMCSFATPNSGSYYGKLLHQAEADGRITAVPHDPRLPVTTSWDLGMDNATSIWFAQITKSGQWRIIDHLSDTRNSLADYVQMLKQRPYTYDRHLLPHDVEVDELGTGRSRRAVLQGLGMTNIRTIPSGPGAVKDGINAVMMVLPLCWFDATKCSKGIKSLRAYHREWNESAQVWSSAPKHDWASDDADSFRMLAIGAREQRQPKAERQRTHETAGGNAWMSG